MQLLLKLDVKMSLILGSRRQINASANVKIQQNLTLHLMFQEKRQVSKYKGDLLALNCAQSAPMSDCIDRLIVK